MDEATRISLKDQFNSLLVQAIEGRRGGMALMRVLEELDFYNSTASAKHHLNVPGGLVLHSHLMAHGEASVSIIKDWIFLTDTEALAIRWHMGAYSGEQDWGTLSKVYDRCPEALCLHMADMIATHIMEVEE